MKEELKQLLKEKREERNEKRRNKHSRTEEANKANKANRIKNNNNRLNLKPIKPFEPSISTRNSTFVDTLDLHTNLIKIFGNSFNKAQKLVNKINKDKDAVCDCGKNNDFSLLNMDIDNKDSRPHCHVVCLNCRRVFKNGRLYLTENVNINGKKYDK